MKKILIFLLLFICNYSYSQLGKSESYIKSHNKATVLYIDNHKYLHVVEDDQSYIRSSNYFINKKGVCNKIIYETLPENEYGMIDFLNTETDYTRLSDTLWVSTKREYLNVSVELVRTAKISLFILQPLTI